MSNVNYSAEQVEKMIAEKLAEQEKALQAKFAALKAEAGPSKPIAVRRKTGTRKTGEKKGQAYFGFEITGNFFPIYLSENVASQLSSVDLNAMLKAAIESPKLEPKADPKAPRLAPAKAEVVKA